MDPRKWLPPTDNAGNGNPYDEKMNGESAYQTQNFYGPHCTSNQKDSMQENFDVGSPYDEKMNGESAYQTQNFYGPHFTPNQKDSIQENFDVPRNEHKSCKRKVALASWNWDEVVEVLSGGETDSEKDIITRAEGIHGLKKRHYQLIDEDEDSFDEKFAEIEGGIIKHRRRLLIDEFEYETRSEAGYEADTYSDSDETVESGFQIMEEGKVPRVIIKSRNRVDDVKK